MNQITGIIGLFMLASAAQATVYYVDSESGNDRAPGTAQQQAWKTLAAVNDACLKPGDQVLFKRGGLWRGKMRAQSGEKGKPILYGAYGNGPKPILENSAARNQESDWIKVSSGIWATQPRRAVSDDSSCLLKDVGILLFNHGEAWGVKKWKLEDLKNPLDYWYDPAEFRVFVRSETNPAKRYRSIELAFTEYIINESNCHDVVYEGLAVRYGGAHGFGGGGTQRLTIRGCDIYWIGGGLQFWKTKDRPVRFGNGIEFWGDAEDNLVERCRLWHIYDAAVTPQGKICRQKNITFRDNVIWDAEYSLEFWNRAPGTSENIRFEHNTCVDAGGAYSHSQRPDINGAHMMFYGHNAISTNLVIRDNIFCGTTERCSRMMCDFRYALDIGNNLYFCAPDKLIIAFCEQDKAKHATYAAGAFARYQAELGMDKGSLFAEPQFIDAAHHDYRLKPGTPGTRLATDGGSVGARF